MHELFEHKADIGIRGIGETKEEAFAECAKAMFSVMVDLETVGSEEKFDIEIETNDLESLLVDFLNHLLYLRDVNETLFNKFDLYIINDRDEWKLNGTGFGEKINKKKHDIKSDVKAASYHQLDVAEKDGKWLAQCVVDV